MTELVLEPLRVGLAATVQVPATCANLGPGFDCVGLAIDLYQETSVRVTDSDVYVTTTGPGSKSLPTDSTNLVASTLRAALGDLGYQAPGLHIHSELTIPLSSGLGSSSAAIVTGLALAWALAKANEPLDYEWIFRKAAELEGHADNVGPAIYGNATVSWQDNQISVARIPVHSAIRVATLVPTHSVATTQAREELPQLVPFADAAANSARAGLLTHALSSKPEYLSAATADYLHQSYREQMYPESLRVVEELRKQGLAAAISGAGPTALVLYDKKDEHRVRSVIQECELTEPFAVNFHQPGRGTVLLP